MTESAYYIFKSPTSLDKRQGFSGSGIQRFQGRDHYTPNLAQEINLSRIQRQLIADKGSSSYMGFDRCLINAISGGVIPYRRVTAEKASMVSPNTCTESRGSGLMALFLKECAFATIATILRALTQIISFLALMPTIWLTEMRKVGIQILKKLTASTDMICRMLTLILIADKDIADHVR